MLRLVFPVASLLLLASAAASPAGEPAAEEPAAEEPAAAESGAAPAEEPAAAESPAAPAAESPAAPARTRAATPAAPFAWRPAAEPAARRLDLTPSRVLRAPVADRRGAERAGPSLGADDWKGQAVQVGAMAAGWVALTALCSGGGCLLPDGLTDWLPGMGRRDDLGVPAAELRPQPPLREAR